jgi:FSR family fosmidomycin resistance protein-like MFS transporter
MFHAASPGIVAHASDQRTGFGMSLFMAGGGLGRTIGPLLVIWAVTQWGLTGIYRLAILGWLTSLILFFQFRRSAFQPSSEHSFNSALPILKSFFLPLSLAIVLRSALNASLTTYLPVYITQSGAPLWMAGIALSALELSGVIGALFLGPLSDTLGRKYIISISMLLSSLLILLFTQISGRVIILVLLFIGFFSISTNTLFLALVQDHFYAHRSTGNGFYLLISLLSNALMLIIIGYIGDTIGLKFAYYFSSIAAFLSIPALNLLPSIHQKNHHDDV